MSKPIVIAIGQRFGRLTIIEEIERIRIFTGGRSRLYRRFRCLCDCQNEIIARLEPLMAGKLSSCGCLPAELLGNLRRTHGMSGCPEHRIWKAMINRTNNPNNPAYGDYAGRGILVCERWKNFANFYTDMGPRPSPQHTIERLNNDQGYNPSNCEWRTRKDQARNRRSSVFVTYDGKRYLLAELCDRLNFTYSVANHRKLRGWEEQDLFLPIGYRQHRKTVDLKKTLLRPHLSVDQ